MQEVLPSQLELENEIIKILEGEGAQLQFNCWMAAARLNEPVWAGTAATEVE